MGEFYERLRQVATEKNLTMIEIATKGDIPTDTLYKQAKQDYPNGRALIQICRALGVSADYLLGLDGDGQ